MPTQLATNAALVTLALSSATALAGLTTNVLVDFDDQVGGLPPVITDGAFNEYVTFSTNEPNSLLIFSGAGFVGGSNPNILTSGRTPNAENFDGDIYMDFVMSANDLVFDVVSDNDSGTVALLNVFHSGGTTEVNVVGNGDFTDVISMDLTSYMDITRIELFEITDEFGLGIDNLSFTVPVPAPAPLALLAIGALGVTRRSR